MRGRLTKRPVRDDAEKDLEYLDRSQVNGRHLRRLINSVLDLPKVEA